MLENPKLRGYILALIATIAMSNVYIFSKAALKEVELIQFGFYWFGFAILWNLIYAMPKKKYSDLGKLKSKDFSFLIVIGLLELAGTTFFFMAINTVENPAIVSFLANMTPIFVTILGILFLKERFNRIEIIGFVLALSGAFIISFQGGGALSEIFIRGTGLVLLSSFIFSFAFVLAKKSVARINAPILSINRVLFLFVFSAILVLVKDVSLAISWKGLYNIILGSLLGPFLTALTQYSAIKYLEASRVSIIQSSKGLFVLAGALIYFGLFPSAYQLAGGLITILGVIFIVGGKKMLSGKR